MKIVFHGANAATFRPDIETYLTGAHDISLLSDELSEADEQSIFSDAEIIIGTTLSKSHPIPKGGISLVALRTPKDALQSLPLMLSIEIE